MKEAPQVAERAALWKWCPTTRERCQLKRRHVAANLAVHWLGCASPSMWLLQEALLKASRVNKRVTSRRASRSTGCQEQELTGARCLHHMMWYADHYIPFKRKGFISTLRSKRTIGPLICLHHGDFQPLPWAGTFLSNYKHSHYDYFLPLLTKWPKAIHFFITSYPRLSITGALKAIRAVLLWRQLNISPTNFSAMKIFEVHTSQIVADILTIEKWI